MKPSVVTVWILAWGAAVLGCFVELGLYAARPGESGTPAARGLSVRAGELPKLVMFLHPRCPCSRASVEELDRIATRVNGKVTIVGMFLSPSKQGRDWVQTDIWDHVLRIPGAKAIRDVDGAEAARLGVKTSGETLLFSGDGKELFRGGITPARGHEGTCPSQDALLQYALFGTAPPPSAPTYGCPLFDGGEGAARS